MADNTRVLIKGASLLGFYLIILGVLGTIISATAEFVTEDDSWLVYLAVSIAGMTVGAVLVAVWNPLRQN